ncbi:hypothetical protein GGS20DRAFT_587994 [Poronia punctata]|nr:hypothetical protein GGS20DRAFT_587994 [Poronia punctata]
MCPVSGHGWADHGIRNDENHCGSSDAPICSLPALNPSAQARPIITPPACATGTSGNAHPFLAARLGESTFVNPSRLIQIAVQLCPVSRTRHDDTRAIARLPPNIPVIRIFRLRIWSINLEPSLEVRTCKGWARTKTIAQRPQFVNVGAGTGRYPKVRPAGARTYATPEDILEEIYTRLTAGRSGPDTINTAVNKVILGGNLTGYSH